jgi:hypothetical protein
MWYNNLDKNFFIKNLYKDIPKMINTRIDKINIHNQGDRISISFDMPYFADNPPKKWIEANYNTVCVHLDFFDIKNIELTSKERTYIGNIDIKKEDDYLIINISGSVQACITAGGGMIQSVTAYQNNI